MRSGRVWLVVATVLGVATAGCWDSEDEAAVAAGKDAGGDEQVDAAPDSVTEEQGVLRGTAQLFGRKEHGGIAIQIEGTSLSTTTGADGTFELTGVPAGTVVLSAAFSPYQPERVLDVAVVADETVTLDPVILRLGKQLRAGEGSVPLGFTPSGAHALYFSDFSPFLGTGTLWAHDVGSDAEVGAGSGVSPMAVVPSPDGNRLAVLRDLAVSTGVGRLLGVDLASGQVAELSDSGSVGAFWFSHDGNHLLYLSDLDAVDQVGDLHIVSTSDWTDRLLAQDVVLSSLEFPETEAVVWFAANLSQVDYSADLYRLDLGAQEPEKVDSRVILGQRWAGGDGESILYLKAPTDYCQGTLATWTPGAAPRPLGTGVPCDAVHVRDDAKEVLFLSDYVNTVDDGTLRRWVVGPGEPSTLSEHVLAGAQRSADGSKLVYWHDMDTVSQLAELSVWDFDSSLAHDLGVSAPWRLSEDGDRLLYFASFDVETQVGDLRTIAFSTGESHVIASDASSNVLEIDPSGRWVAYQMNPILDTFMGDLWVFDASTQQSVLLAEGALPVVRWSPASPFAAFFTEPDADFVTALGHVKALDDGATASLGRVWFLADQLRFGETGEWLTFFRNPVTEAMTGDLWVWDGAVDSWEGDAVGTEVTKNVGAWSARMVPTGILVESDITPNWDAATLSFWSLSKRATVVLGANVLPDSAALSVDGEKLLFVSDVKGVSTGDLHFVKLSDPAPVLLGKAAHMQSFWTDEAWSRVAFVANAEGDLGELTVAELPSGTTRVLGEGVPFFGVQPSPDGSTMAFLHGWDSAQTRGQLSTVQFGDPTAEVMPVDEDAPLTYLVSDDQLFYVVQGTERAGIYLAPLVP
jgi:hypothetical protein